MKAFLTSCTLILAMSVSAQPVSNIAAKASSTGQRVIILTRKYNLGTSQLFTDSLNFSYSNGRGSDFEPVHLFYYTATSFAGGVDFLPFAACTLRPTILDDSNNPHLAFDSVTMLTNDLDSSLAFKTIATGSRYYNSNNEVASAVAYSFDTPGNLAGTRRQVLIYQAGRVATIYSIENLGIDDTLYARFISYDPAGNPVVDSATIEKYAAKGVHLPYSSYHYTYNSSGQYTSRLFQWYDLNTGAISGAIRTTNLFQNNGLLYTRNIENYNSASKSFTLSSIDTLTYLPGTSVLSNWLTADFDINGNATANAHQYSYHFNAQLKCDTLRLLQKQAGTWMLNEFAALTYNANGYPVTKIRYDALGVTPRFLIAERYYYQPYTLGITPILASSAASTTSIYPNPTTGRITINHPDLKPGTPITIFISNTAGQAVHAESLTVQGTKTEMTLGDEAPPGIYNIRISGAGNAVLHSGTFLKL